MRLSPYLRLVLMPDETAERVESGMDRADRATLARWVKELLADRRSRTAILQGQTRRLAYARRRFQQAAHYLDGLLKTAQEEANAAWPGKLPCPHCGAPAIRVRAEQRSEGHALVLDHPDGKRCEGEAQSVHRTDPHPCAQSGPSGTSRVEKA